MALHRTGTFLVEVQTILVSLYPCLSPTDLCCLHSSDAVLVAQLPDFCRAWHYAARQAISMRASSSCQQVQHVACQTASRHCTS